MAIFNTPQDTTQMHGRMVETLHAAIQRAMTAKSLQEMYINVPDHLEKTKFFAVTGGDVYSDAIPNFAHPILVRDVTDTTKHSSVLVVDLRAYGSWNKLEGKFAVRRFSGPAYHLLLQRVILQQHWLVGNYALLRDCGKAPAQLYYTIFTALMKSKFGLPYEAEARLGILALYFYQSLFHRHQSLSEADRLTTMRVIQNLTSLPSQLVAKVVEELDGQVVPDVSVLAEKIHELCASPALQSFNYGSLLTVLHNSWFGSGDELMGVAIEHVPTWLALTSASLFADQYRETNMSKLARKFVKPEAAKQFAASIRSLTGGKAGILLVDRAYGREIEDPVFAEYNGNL